MGLKIEGLSFLVVDDNEHMRRLVRRVLNGMGVEQVRGAVDGSAAISELKVEVPDILITDWLMGPMDGLQLTHFLRKGANSPNRFLPIIMMTGFAEREKVFQARDAGVTEFLVKPLSASSLFSRIQAIVEKPRPFVHIGEFFGPDRRRRKNEFQGEDKRGATASPKQKKIDMHEVMSQKAINDLFNPE
ncbi:MAG TPA: response regulator [Rhodospirillaceae bacterium]|nr:response regulator [Rhodospirillaceae bacterium]